MKLLSILTITFLISFNFFEAQTVKISKFKPELLSQFPNVRDFTIDQNSGDILLSVQNFAGGNSTIIVISKKENQWTSPEVAIFSGRYNDLEPFFSKNGLSLYFASNRPLDQTSDTVKDFDIWVVNRKTIDDKWGLPINLGKPINTEKDEFYPAITDSGNLYFTLNKNQQGSKDDIYVSSLVKGKYEEPVPVEGGVNTDGYEFNAYISPDESFMIFSGYNRVDGFGSGDLYISKRDVNGIWKKAVNLGKPINSEKLDYCPFIDFNTKTLYFTSLREQYKSNNSTKRTIEDLLKLFETKDGLSKIYKADVSDLLNSMN